MKESPTSDVLHARFFREILKRVRERYGVENLSIPMQLLSALESESKLMLEEAEAAIRDGAGLISLEENNRRSADNFRGEHTPTNIACPKCGSPLLKSRTGWRFGDITQHDGVCSNGDCDWQGKINS